MGFQRTIVEITKIKSTRFSGVFRLKSGDLGGPSLGPFSVAHPSPKRPSNPRAFAVDGGAFEPLITDRTGRRSARPTIGE